MHTGPYTAVRQVKLNTGGEARHAERINEGIEQGLSDRRLMTEPPQAEGTPGVKSLICLRDPTEPGFDFDEDLALLALHISETPPAERVA